MGTSCSSVEQLSISVGKPTLVLELRDENLVPFLIGVHLIHDDELYVVKS